MRRPPGGRLLLLLLGTVCLHSACSDGEPRQAAPVANVLLITLDTLRADHIGAYGATQVSTPVIDTLAGGGVLFETAVTPAVMTLPSHASILTGTYPPTHGIRDNGDYRLADGALTLAEVMRPRGWRTFAVVGSFVLDSMFGLDQGFEAYDDALPARRPDTGFWPERAADTVTDSAIRFMRQAGQESFLLWVHYFDAHYPYTAPAAYLERYPDSGYSAEIAYLDAQVGRLLEAMRAMGLERRTLIVLVADHGEGLGDHGEESHGVFLYDETARVPLIISYPGRLPEGRRVPDVVSTVDLMPTILELAGMDPGEAAAPVQGTSLVSLLDDAQRGRPELPAYSEAMVPLLMYGWSPLSSIRDGRYKYIEAPRPELYDLAADPGERRDLSQSMPQVVSEYHERLEMLRAEITRDDTAAETLSPDPEAEAKLRSLGYVSGGSRPAAAREPARSDLADPKDKVAMLSRIHRVYSSFGAGDYDTVVDEARSILTENPDNASVRYYLAGALVWLGRHEEALREFEALLERSPHDTEALSNMGWCLIGMRRFEDARKTYERVLELNPYHLHARASLGNIALLRGDPAAAERIYRELLDDEPDHLPSILALAGMYASTGRRDEAAAWYERAVEAGPGDVDAWIRLAGVRNQQGRQADTLEILERARTHVPDSPRLPGAAGDVLIGLGKVQEARAAYQSAISLDEGYASGWYGLGYIELRFGDPAKAVDFLGRAVSLNPAKTAWREALARALAGAGRYDAAAIELQRFLESTPGLTPRQRDQVRREIDEYSNRGRQP